MTRVGSGLLAMPLLLAGLACAPPPPEVPAGTPVVLISVDTLRADRLPVYGYGGVETPAIDRLRRDSLLFERTYSHTPLTLPAHSSLLTGVLPGEHGLRDNVGYALDREGVRTGSLTYLPHAFRQAGYATGGFISSFVLRGKLGLDEGFDVYEDGIEFRTGGGLGGLQRPGGETLGLASEWLESVADRPFFLFFHIYEPHTPYEPPEPFRSRYPQPYDGEVAAADRIVGELLDRLRELELYDRALIVLLSDHGEGLGEHGEEEHGVLLYTSTLQVPLMIKLPGGTDSGRSVRSPAQLVDLYPTLAGVFDLPGSDRLRGRSLLDLAQREVPDRRIYSETFYPRIHFGWSELSSLIAGRFQYIDGPEPELYDLAADPGQTRNLIRQQARKAAELRQELESFDRRLQAPGEVDPETRRALAALGYVGTVAVESEGPLPDPKSRLDTLADLKAGFKFYSERDYRPAAGAFRRALEENPQMLDAWEYLARSLQKLGDYETALEAYETALRLSGGAAHIAILVASLYYDLGRFDEAEAHALLAVESHSSFAHGLLAQIALQRKDLAEAERQAELALDESQPRLGPQITLAAIAHARGEYEEALKRVEDTERAYLAREARDPELIQGLFLLKGKVLANLGEAEAAEAAFRQELELFPESLETYTNLAVLYALTGRGERVGALLREMVEARPTARAYAEAVRTLRVLNDSRSADSLLSHARGKFPDSEVLDRLMEEG